MQGYAKEICRTRFFVGLRIEVDAPGVLAAIRPWREVRVSEALRGNGNVIFEKMLVLFS